MNKKQIYITMYNDIFKSIYTFAVFYRQNNGIVNDEKFNHLNLIHFIYYYIPS